MKEKKVKKIVLAYSGGLDTSVILRWLIDSYDCPVVAFAADLGQGEELAPLEQKAKASGAASIHIVDLREEFVATLSFRCCERIPRMKAPTSWAPRLPAPA